MHYSLPQIATAPFCPSEVRGQVVVPPNATLWQKLRAFSGPGLLVAVGYVDPGNWATDIAAGAKYGYGLLFMVLLSSLAAIFLQCMSMRVGVVSGRDMAQLSRETFKPKTNILLWLSAELAIIATDIAEVLGCALAFHLLLGVPLWVGILITALDTLIVLGLQGRGFRRLEAIILGLLLTIAICYVVEIWLVQPYWPDVARGLVPSLSLLADSNALYLAIGIIGATVMPHNLYLHSSIVGTRKIGSSVPQIRSALRMNTFDTAASLTLAFLVNAAILVLAASAFHFSGNMQVDSIDGAYNLLTPLVGTSLAALLFGIALLASGQSSTFTGTIAGQIILEGFLKIKIPCWQRRVITRSLALLPAFFGVVVFGDGSVGSMMVLSQVVLGLQLPFAIYTLIRFASSRNIMGDFVVRWWVRLVAWGLFAAISGCNIWLIWQLALG